MLRWTPGLFAAQDGMAPGHTIASASPPSDGSAGFTREIEIVVRNVNQAPVLLPMPLQQLIPEGRDPGLCAARHRPPTNDAMRLALIYDANTPEGVYFDPNTGYFEWTPGQGTVDNLSADTRAFNFTFSADDGQTVSYRTVQVRVFDVNRTPEIQTASRALLVGAGLCAAHRARCHRPRPARCASSTTDGTAQTEALSVSFSRLPEGARYDAASGRLLWTPGPGQVGDFIVLATVSDGRNSITRGFTLRVVADPTRQCAQDPRQPDAQHPGAAGPAGAGPPCGHRASARSRSCRCRRARRGRGPGRLDARHAGRPGPAAHHAQRPGAGRVARHLRPTPTASVPRTRR